MVWLSLTPSKTDLNITAHLKAESYLTIFGDFFMYKTNQLQKKNT